MDQYIWAKIWKLTIMISQCPPELPKLLELREAIRAHLQIAQEMKLKVEQAGYAERKLRETYKQR